MEDIVDFETEDSVYFEPEDIVDFETETSIDSIDCLDLEQEENLVSSPPKERISFSFYLDPPEPLFRAKSLGFTPGLPVFFTVDGFAVQSYQEKKDPLTYKVERLPYGAKLQLEGVLSLFLKTMDEERSSRRETVAQCVEFMRDFLPQMESYCAVCGRWLEQSCVFFALDPDAGKNKPSSGRRCSPGTTVPCHSELCMWTYQNSLGINSEYREKVVSIVSRFFLIALKSNVISAPRSSAAAAPREELYDPLPFVDIPSLKLQKGKILTPAMKNELVQCLSPGGNPPSALQTGLLSQINAIIRPLIQPEERVPFFEGEQFILLMSRGEKYQRFCQLREKYGSLFLFHGTSADRMHCILNKGLRNLSNTAFMQCGAAYGPGIYLSPVFQVSSGYCKGEVSCILICEVVNNPAVLIRNTPDNWRLTDNDHIATRFMIVNPLPRTASKEWHPSKLSTLDEKTRDILFAMAKNTN